jgi:hypothetical protein
MKDLRIILGCVLLWIGALLLMLVGIGFASIPNEMRLPPSGVTSWEYARHMAYHLTLFGVLGWAIFMIGCHCLDGLLIRWDDWDR